VGRARSERSGALPAAEPQKRAFYVLTAARRGQPGRNFAKRFAAATRTGRVLPSPEGIWSPLGITPQAGTAEANLTY